MLEPRSGPALERSVRAALGLPDDGRPMELVEVRTSYFSSCRDGTD